jgi:putative hydrolase of HD superfamily
MIPRMITKGKGQDELLGADPSTDPTLAAYARVMRLKRLYRQGWLKRGVPEGECESVADHSFGVAMLALLAAPQGIDRAKAALLAIAHELGETYAGDITPADGVPAGEKARLEREACEKALEGHPAAGELMALWEEFERGETPEARFVRELDRLEMGIQAAVYAAEGKSGMPEFFQSARRTVRTPSLCAVLERSISLSSR